MESFKDPDSPLSTNSLVFDGNNWVMPLDEHDVNPRNFCPPRTSSSVPSSKLSFKLTQNNKNKNVSNIFNNYLLIQLNIIMFYYNQKYIHII